eukprot:m.239560 g.239560  ORF g.239560 m.239560 type:complete len:968 (+) comp13498_c0_seq1:141-3044(+)
MDEFEQTVMTLYSPETPPQHRQQAMALFDQYKYSPDAWVMCAQKFIGAFYQQELTQAACVQVIEAVVQTRYDNLDEPHQNFVRELLRAWLRERPAAAATPVTIVNKMAHLFAIVFVHEFPTKWPAFFTEITAMVNMSPVAADIFLRIMLAIDEEVVDRDIERSAAVNARNTALKDSMRLGAMPAICDAWKAVFAYEAAQPALVGTCLRAMSLYVSWIDLGLVANDGFLAPVFSYLNSGVNELRVGACELVSALVNKGMPPPNKVQLLVSLQIVPRVSAAKAAITADEDNEYVASLSRLTDNIGLALIGAIKTLRGANADCTDALAVLDDALQLQFSFYSHEDDGVSESVTEFAREYVHLLKQIGALSPTQQEHLRTLLQITVLKMKYDPAEFNFSNPSDTEDAFLAFRVNLKTIICNIAQLNAAMVLAFGHQIVQALESPGLGFTDLEVIVHFVYLLGEAIPGPHLAADGVMVLEPLVAAVVTSGAAQHSHSAVLGEYFELVTRFYRYFVLHPDHIPPVLTAFLSRGLTHPLPSLRSIACYQFTVFVRGLCVQMRAYVSDILAALVPLLAPDPRADSEKYLRSDDQLSLYEAAGFLVAVESLGTQERLQILGSLLSPLLDRYSTILTRELAVAPDIRTQNQLHNFLSFAISACTRISKGISGPDALDACGARSLFERAVTVFVGVLRVQRAPVRNELFTFLHRMVAMMGLALLPVLPQIAELLVVPAEGGPASQMDVLKLFITLLNQVVSRHRDPVAPVLVRTLPVILPLIVAVLRLPVDTFDQNARAEMTEFRRSFFLLVHTIVSTGCTSALLAPEVLPYLQDLMGTVTEGCQNIADGNSQKLCVLIFRRLAQQWLGATGAAVPGFGEFMLSQVVSGCFRGCLQPGFNVGDAQSWLLLTEFALLLRCMVEKMGPPFLEYLTALLLGMALPPPIVGELTDMLARPENPQDRGALGKLLKSIIVRSRM